VPPRRDRAFDELFASLAGLHRVLRAQAHAAVRPSGPLSRPEVATLAVIARCGPCRSSAVAEHLGVGASVVSRQLAHFAGLGLVRREADPDDGRAELVSLTDAGRQWMADGRASYVARLSECLSDWDARRVAEATTILDELAARLAPRPRGTVDQPRRDQR